MFKVQSLRQSSRGKYPYFGDTRFNKISVGQVEESLHAKNSLIGVSVSTLYRTVKDVRHEHRLIASIALA